MAHVSINWRMDKPMVVQSCYGMLLSIKTEQITDTSNTWMNLKTIMPIENSLP